MAHAPRYENSRPVGFVGHLEADARPVSERIPHHRRGLGDKVAHELLGDNCLLHDVILPVFVSVGVLFFAGAMLAWALRGFPIVGVR